jgi:hypothetical protein
MEVIIEEILTEDYDEGVAALESIKQAILDQPTEH